MRSIIITSFLSMLYLFGNAQEFSASVRVTAPTLQLADPKILKQLEGRVTEFMNTNRWTDDSYEPEERIKLNIQLTITKDLSVNNFRIDFGIQATRPVYNSSYESSILSHLDKNAAIEFEEFRPIVATQNNYVDNLSSLLSYYAYLVLGLDRDSFTPFGGDKYLVFCQEIVNSIPPSIVRADPSWVDPTRQDTRYTIVDDLLNPKMKAYRQGWYDYHRKGLDFLYGQTEEGKKNITEVIRTVDDLNNTYPNMFIIRIFANTKANEITQIFKVGEQKDRFEMYTMMSRIDPANSSKYEPIRKG